MSDVLAPPSVSGNDNDLQQFQGVVCCCFERNFQDTICKLLNPTKSNYQNCFDLMLKNKYYEAKIQLFDYNEFKMSEHLVDCHAIILYGQPSIDQLEEKSTELENVQSGPRIVLCDTIIQEDLRDWCISNGYDLWLTSDDDVKTGLIDSLSSYKWAHRTDADNRELHGDYMKKLTDFDSLLSKLSAYRERPDGKNIEEIADILSGLLDDDVDKFFESEAPVDHESKSEDKEQK